jgi:type VI secretion system secreted protein Hcp
MAQGDYLLKLDGVTGESQQDGHKEWIEIQSWSWGVANAGSSGYGSGAGSGKASVQDFHFVVTQGVASPILFQKCATGEPIGKAELHVRKAGGDQQVFITWKFSDVLLSSYQTGASGGGDPLPTDQVSFNFTKLEVEYKPQNADGTLGAAIPGGYNVKTGKSS